MKGHIIFCLLLFFNSKYNFTERCELHRVANQVQHDLTQTGRITQQTLRHVRQNVIQELEALLVGANTHHAHGAVQTLPQIEVNDLHVELPSLDLGEVEDVIDQREQRIR